jgi:hypothetical protein
VNQPVTTTTSDPVRALVQQVTAHLPRTSTNNTQVRDCVLNCPARPGTRRRPARLKQPVVGVCRDPRVLDAVEVRTDRGHGVSGRPLQAAGRYLG